MKIKQIGHTFPTDIFSEISYLSNDYLLDADILIIDMHAVLREFEKKFRLCGSTYAIEEDVLQQFLRKAKERKQELLQYLKTGLTLFVFNCDVQQYTFKVYSNSQVFNEFTLDFFSLLHLDSADFILKEQQGTNIVATNTLSKSFLNYFERVSYKFIFQTYVGAPLYSIKMTKETVGVAIPMEFGNILLLPRLEANDTLFEKAFIDMHSSFAQTKKESKSLPKWCLELEIGNEKLEKSKMESLQIELEKIENLMVKQSEILEYYTKLKRLLTATGDELEEVVSYSLKELGYTVIKPNGNRDDLIIKRDNEVGVVEIKGVKYSAAEKHAAQLMKWVNTYHLDNEVYPKGILIVNSFKDIPIGERTEDTFPSQMIPYCRQMKFSLISTHQLLDFIIKNKENQITAEEVHSKIFNTIGVLMHEPVLKEMNEFTN